MKAYSGKYLGEVTKIDRESSSFPATAGSLVIRVQEKESIQEAEEDYPAEFLELKTRPARGS